MQYVNYTDPNLERVRVSCHCVVRVSSQENLLTPELFFPSSRLFFCSQHYKLSFLAYVSHSPRQEIPAIISSRRI